MKEGNNLLDNDELMALARHAIGREDYHDALVKLKFLLTREDANTDAYALLGRVYASLDLHEKAIAAFEQYLGSEPEVIPERFHLGVVYREMGDNAKALEIWDEVLERAPGFPPALYNKALFLLDEGDKEEAVKILTYIVNNVSPDDNHVEVANRMLASLSIH